MAAGMPCRRPPSSITKVIAKPEIESEKISKTVYGCHEDHIAGKGFTSMSHYNLAHKIIQMPQTMKILDAKAAVDKEWKMARDDPSMEIGTVKSKKEVVLEAQRDNKKVHFATLMDICHLKNAELELKFQKDKGSVVLRRDTVKDDSGAQAAFTEQGLSAFKMSASKIMNFIARLPGCDGQVADAVSAKTHVKLEDAHRLLKIRKSECSVCSGYVFYDTNGQNHVEKLKIPWYSLNETCTIIHLPECYGKDNSEKLY